MAANHPRPANHPRSARAHGTLICLLLGLSLVGVQPWTATAHAAGGQDAQIRVVGGAEATLADAPWMAAIVTHSGAGGNDSQRQFCGGSLLAPTVVMTAAHCVRGRSASGMQVVLGRTDLTSSTGQRHDVAAVITHPLFAFSSYQNDVALLLLAQPSAQQQLTLVDPATARSLPPMQPATVMGWGSTSEGGQPSPLLRTAGINILPDRDCLRSSAYGADFARAQMLCAGTAAGGAGSCSGDSGGPLTTDVGGRRAVGIVSWARGCVRPGLPTVYTRLGNPSINAWIRAATDSLSAGRTSAPPPRTIVRAIGLRSGTPAPRLHFASPGQAWASFQCSSRGRGFRLCPASAGARSRALKGGDMRVRAVNLFGGVDPSPALLHASRRR